MGATSNTNIGSYQVKVKKETMTRLEKGDGLIHSPQIMVPEPSVFLITGKKEDPRTKPWGYWFGGAFVVLVILHFFQVGTAVAWSTREIVIGVSLLGIAILFLKYGVTTRFLEREIASIDGNRGTLTIFSTGLKAKRPSGEPKGISVPPGEERVMALAEIEEVVFGMVQFPVRDNGTPVTVHAFSLLIRVDDVLIPVVEASPDKGALFEAAKLIGKVSGAPLIQVGDGIRID